MKTLRLVPLLVFSFAALHAEELEKISQPGAITGTVAASVIAMGMISLPIMIKYGYNIRHATGVIAASGTITQLIPPSLVLVVLADQLGKPVGQMYLGAMGASVIQVVLFMLWSITLCLC